MDIFGLAVFIILIGALLWVGWHIAPFVIVGALLYFVIRYPKETARTVKSFFKGLRGGKR